MTYASSADKMDEHKLLLPIWFIVIFILTTFCIAIFLFPSRTLHYQVLHVTKPQPVTAFYLSQLITQHPDDGELRIALVRQQIGLYRFAAAEEEINWLAQHAYSQDETRLLKFELQYTQAYQLPLGSERNKAFTQLRAEIATLTSLALSQQQFVDLARAALSLNDPAVALVFYRRLTDVKDPVLLRQIARTALATSEYAVSAQYYMEAKRYENDINMQRKDVITALKALQAGGLLNEGLQIIASLPNDIINNKPMLIFLTKYTLAAGRPDLAQTYVKRVLLSQELTTHG